MFSILVSFAHLSGILFQSLSSLKVPLFIIKKGRYFGNEHRTSVPEGQKV